MGRPATRTWDYIKPSSSGKYQARRGRALDAFEQLKVIVPFMREQDILTKENCLVIIQTWIDKVFADD